MKTIFKNGWYRMETEEGSALYRADGTLVADKLIGCNVYENGNYKIETEEGPTLYRADGTLIKKA